MPGTSASVRWKLRPQLCATGDAGTRDALFASYLDRWLPVIGWKVRDKYGAAAVFAALLQATLFDDALFGVKSASEEEIAERAGEAATQMLALIEAGRL
jgi:TetR/AcrR family transcriptional repressor of mexJK operon